MRRKGEMKPYSIDAYAYDRVELDAFLVVPGGLWLEDGRTSRGYRQRRLLRAGYIELARTGLPKKNGQKAQITEAGRAALAEAIGP